MGAVHFLVERTPSLTSPRIPNPEIRCFAVFSPPPPFFRIYPAGSPGRPSLLYPLWHLKKKVATDATRHGQTRTRYASRSPNSWRTTKISARPQRLDLPPGLRFQRDRNGPRGMRSTATEKKRALLEKLSAVKGPVKLVLHRFVLRVHCLWCSHPTCV